MDVDFSRTIEQALRLHPKARRLVIVTGTAPQDRSFEAQLREDVVRFGNRVQPEFLSGLSTSVLLKRLAGLKADAVVFTPGLFQDGDGRSFLPREAVRAIAAAASVPVYAPFNTYLGTGIVGGCMTSREAMGRDAGEIASRLLDGTAPGSLGLTEPKPAPRLPTA